MRAEQYDLREDGEFIYIPESLFRYLPEEYREAVEARKVEGENLLGVVDKDLLGLMNLVNAIPTTASLSYLFQRLRTAKFEATTESVMELQAFTTAFVVTYGRLFAKGNGARKLSIADIPAHLRPIHDEIISLRNSRFAHNDTHNSVSSGISIVFDDQGFQLSAQMSLGFYIGGRNEWEELIAWIDALMHDRLRRILSRLKEKTGYEWSFPNGPPPEWGGDSG